MIGDVLNCKGCVEHLCDYLDGLLSSGTRAQFDQHLERCRKCRALCGTTEQMLRLYRRFAPCEVPPDVEARLFSALEAKADNSRGHPRLGSRV
jgi:anti-sigma factor RsiW